MSKTKEIAAGRNRSTNNDKPIASIPPEVSAAAKTLGALPKQKFAGRRRIKRRWSGFISGVRCWQGRLIVMPDGRIVELQRALRGIATVRLAQNGGEGPTRCLVVPTHSLQVLKRPEAVLLGQRKLGMKEKKSGRKAETSRENGKMPARPGHHKRGRPRQNAPEWQRYVLRTDSQLRPDMTVDQLLNLAIRQRAELKAAIKKSEERDRQKALHRYQPPTT